MRGVEGGEGIKKGGREEWKVMFWNVAGLKKKDRDFWRGLEAWDVIVMIETWVDEKGWERVRRWLPRGYMEQWAKRKNKKGRAMGGMIMGIRKELNEKEQETYTEKEGIMMGGVRVGGERWKIIGV